MPAGRPTKYKKEFCKQIVDFFDKDLYIIEKDKEGFVTSKRIVEFPTLEKFAHTIGVCRDTLHRWSTDKEHPEFSDAYKKAVSLQEDLFTRGCMEGVWNTTFAIFLAKNKFGWKDQKEVHQKIELGGPMKINIIQGDHRK
jgi:DNA-binding XRE family transcriptional regulator